MVILGVVGTAKNTGKTTTLFHIVTECLKREIYPAVTSIGYDGEDIDNLTYLPKPKLLIKPGSIVATSELCLKTTKAKFEFLYRTDITTPLGNISIVKISEEGEIVIAGPNNIKDLKTVLELLKIQNPNLIIIDGAFNRMAPMFLADKIIMTTGAARNTDIGFLSNEIFVFNQIFKIRKSNSVPKNINTIILDRGEIIDTKIPYLLDKSDYDDLLKYNLLTCKRIILPKVFSLTLLKDLAFYLSTTKEKLTEIVILEPFRLLSSAYSSNYNDLLDIFRENIVFSFVIKPGLLAVTVNPFYPKYENFCYKSGYIDKTKLLNSIREKVRLPVYNIFDNGVTDLVDMVLPTNN